MHEHLMKIAAFFLIPIAALAFSAAAEPQLIVLVRHAERATEAAGDPALSEAGIQRAEALATALEHVGITAIITSNFRRTRETAQPLAKQLGLTPISVAIRKGDVAAHIQDVAAAVRSQSGRVLVVGHSNTIAAIVQALGGPAMPELCETSFSHVFVMAPKTNAAPALLRLHYGDGNAPAAPDCQ